MNTLSQRWTSAFVLVLLAVPAIASGEDFKWNYTNSESFGDGFFVTVSVTNKLGYTLHETELSLKRDAGQGHVVGPNKVRFGTIKAGETVKFTFEVGGCSDTSKFCYHGKLEWNCGYSVSGFDDGTGEHRIPDWLLNDAKNLGDRITRHNDRQAYLANSQVARYNARANAMRLEQNRIRRMLKQCGFEDIDGIAGR